MENLKEKSLYQQTLENYQGNLNNEIIEISESELESLKYTNRNYQLPFEDFKKYLKEEVFKYILFDNTTNQLDEVDYLFPNKPEIWKYLKANLSTDINKKLRQLEKSLKVYIGTLNDYLKNKDVTIDNSKNNNTSTNNNIDQLDGDYFTNLTTLSDKLITNGLYNNMEGYQDPVDLTQADIFHYNYIKLNFNEQYVRLFKLDQINQILNGKLGFQELFNQYFPDYSNKNENEILENESDNNKTLSKLEDIQLVFIEKIAGTTSFLKGSEENIEDPNSGDSFTKGKIVKLPNISLKNVLELIQTEKYKNIDKKSLQRPAIAPGKTCRPKFNAIDKETGDFIGYTQWTGVQLFDIDIKDATIAPQVRDGLHQQLKNYPWYVATTLSTSGSGLHIYTYEDITNLTSTTSGNHLLKQFMELDRKDLIENTLKYFYKYTYTKKGNIIENIILNNFQELAKEANQRNEKSHIIEEWIDLHSDKITQPLYIASDKDIKINPNFEVVSIFYPCKHYDNQQQYSFLINPKDKAKKYNKTPIAKTKKFTPPTFSKSDNPGLRKKDWNIVCPFDDSSNIEDIKKLLHTPEHLDYSGRWNVANTLSFLFPKNRKLSEAIFNLISDKQDPKETTGIFNTAYGSAKLATKYGIFLLKSHGFPVNYYAKNKNEILNKNNNPSNTNGTPENYDRFNKELVKIKAESPDNLKPLDPALVNDNRYYLSHLIRDHKSERSTLENEMLNIAATRVQQTNKGLYETSFIEENTLPINAKPGDYLSNYSKTIENFFENFKDKFNQPDSKYLTNFRYLIAPPGSGKTEYAKIQAHQYLNEKGIRTIIFEPMLSIISNKFNHPDYYIVTRVDDFDKIMTDEKLKKETEGKIFIAVFDKFLMDGRLDFKKLSKYNITNIFFDESHLIHTSAYRERFSKFFDEHHFNNVKFLQSEEGKKFTITLMTGTPIGEHKFIGDLQKVPTIIYDNIESNRGKREKNFEIRQVETKRQMYLTIVKDVVEGIMERNVKPMVIIQQGETAVEVMSNLLQEYTNYYCQKHNIPTKLIESKYYARQNKDLIDVTYINNTSQWPENTDVLFCTSYLSAGIDINTPGDFELYFMSIEPGYTIDQFCNRIRKGNINSYIYTYQYIKDSKTGEIEYNDIKTVHPIDINREEDRESIKSIFRWVSKKFNENRDVDYTTRRDISVEQITRSYQCIHFDREKEKYILSDEALNQYLYERGLVEYHQQLPVLLNRMHSFGYKVGFQSNWKPFEDDGMMNRDYLMNIAEGITDKNKDISQGMILDILSVFNDDTIYILQQVMEGKFELKNIVTHPDYIDFELDGSEDLPVNILLDEENKTLYARSTKVVEKVLPIITSLSRNYDMATIREIFVSAKRKNGTYNMKELMRIKQAAVINKHYQSGLYNVDSEALIEDVHNMVKYSEDYKVEEVMNLETGQYEEQETGKISKRTYHELLDKYTEKTINTCDPNLTIFGHLRNKKEKEIALKILKESIKQGIEEITKTILKVGRFGNKSGMATVEIRKANFLTKYEKWEQDNKNMIMNIKIPRIITDMGGRVIHNPNLHKYEDKMVISIGTEIPRAVPNFLENK